jgi:TolA-binding protein
MLRAFMMPIETNLRDLRRRVFASRFLAAAAEGAPVVAGACALIALSARLLDRSIPPSQFLVAAVVPLAYGLWKARRELPAPATLAAWMDRRGGLGGLLVTSRELDAAAWEDELARRFAHATIPQPPLFRREDGLRVLGAVAVAVGIALLPALVKPPPRPGQPAVAVATAEVRQELERLRRDEAIDRATAEDLAARLERLEEKLAEGDPVSWSEVDAIERRMAEAKESHSDALEAARDAAAAALAADGPDAAAQLNEMARALERATKSGALDGLSPELRARLAAATGESTAATGETADASAELTPEEMRALAADLAAALDGELDDLAEAGLGDAKKGRQAAARGAREWEEAEDHVHGPECEGGT